MKKLTLILSMLIALVGLNANAAMYIVGQTPFGNWNPGAGVEMTLENGVYTYTATINGTVYFVFGDGLNSDWTTFNNDHRYGPANGNEAVTAGAWKTTQKAGDHGAYYFQGSGEEYVFTFDEANHQFKVEGYVEPVVFTSFTVAGNNADIFGEAWNTELTANDMTLDATDGLYKLVKTGVEISAGYTLEYKVVANHSWDNNWGKTPGGDNQDYTFNEAGTYDLTFKFDLENETVELEPELQQVGPVVDPITGDFFILGQVNSNNWNPSTGIEMATTDEDVYTLTDAVFTDSGDGYAYFSFTSKLGADEDDWGFAAYRRGAVEDGTLVEDGVNAVLNDWGTNFAFKVAPGTYDVEVGLSSDYVKLTLKETPPEPQVDDVYIFGDVNNYAWDPTQGVKMTYNEGVYTAEVNTTLRENEENTYIGFTKMLADPESETPWDDIAAYRFGPVSDGAFVMTEELLGVACDLATNGSYESIALPEGTWTVAVDLVNNKFTVNGTWPTDTVIIPPVMVYTVVGPESIFGSNWNPADTTNDMILNEGVYTWTKEEVTLYGNFEFKVVGNHDYAIYEWPIGMNNWVANVAEEGIYTIEITFDPEAEDADRITCTLTKTGEVAPVEHTYTVAGTDNLFGSYWVAADEANDMVKGEDGIYTWTKDGVAFAAEEVVEFKVVQDHAWDYSWPSSNWYWQAQEAGNYNVVITFNPEADDMNKITFTATLVPAYTRGDVDMDGEIGIADVTALIDYILSGNASNISLEAANTDLDDTIGIADVTTLIDYILNKHW